MIVPRGAALLGAIRDTAGSWFVGHTRELGGVAIGEALFGARDDRARFDLPDAAAIAEALIHDGHDVAIVCEAFPSLGL